MDLSNIIVNDQTIYVNEKTYTSALNVGERINNCIHVSDSQWVDAGFSYLIPRILFNDFSRIEITPHNERTSYIAFLKSDTQEYVDYCENTTIIKSDVISIYDIPNDCRFVYVYDYYSSTDKCYPEKIYFCTKYYISVSEITNINNNIEDLQNIDTIIESDVYNLKTILLNEISALNKGQHINNCIRTGADYWLNGGWCYLLSKTEFSQFYKTITITPHTGGSSWIAFLKSDTQSYADFCDNTSTINVVSEITFVVPNDCNFIYIFDYYNSGDTTSYPQEIILKNNSKTLLELSDEVNDLSIETTKLSLTQKLFSGEYSKLVFQDLIEDIDLSQYRLNGNIIVIGDSTIAGYITNTPIVSHLTVTGTVTDISAPSDTIAGQTNKYNNLTTEIKNNANYIFVQIGLNDNKIDRIDKNMFLQYQTLINTIHTNSSSAVIILGMMLPCRQRFYDLAVKEQADIVYHNYLELNSAIANSLFMGVNNCSYYHYTIMSDDNGNLLSKYDTGDHIHPNIAGGKVIAWSWLITALSY